MVLHDTFLEMMAMDTKEEPKSDASNIDPNVEKDVLREKYYPFQKIKNSI